jgi:predicted nucleic acid-binding protein
VIVVDTNVLSEPLQRTPDPGVLAWLAEHGHEIALTAITVHELLYGVQRLPKGKRRTGLAEAIERLIRGAGDRVLEYDEEAARTHATLRVARETTGQVSSVEDGMIAAIAVAHRAVLATQNVTDFEGFGVQVVNPWSAG